MKTATKDWQIVVRSTNKLRTAIDAELTSLKSRLGKSFDYRWALESLVNGLLAVYLNKEEAERNKRAMEALKALPAWEDATKQEPDPSVSGSLDYATAGKLPIRQARAKGKGVDRAVNKLPVPKR